MAVHRPRFAKKKKICGVVACGVLFFCTSWVPVPPLARRGNGMNTIQYNQDYYFLFILSPASLVALHRAAASRSASTSRLVLLGILSEGSCDRV